MSLVRPALLQSVVIVSGPASDTTVCVVIVSLVRPALLHSVVVVFLVRPALLQSV